MTDDLLPVLTRFHREVILPDIKRVVEESERRLRDEMQTGFDALAQRMGKLETEKMALRSELLELKSRVDALQEQVRTIEARLEE